MLNRLVNIELAHLALLRQGLGSQADWVLIVEDDALLAEPDGFSVALASFVTNRSTQEQPAYVNVSRSFDSGALGLDRHLTRVGAWDSSTAMLSADRPLTNTVCAVLYRGAFLQDLVPALEAIPISPVLPIDWKLNAALLSMQASGSLGAGDCWFLDPAPIVQGSMHAPAG